MLVAKRTSLATITIPRSVLDEAVLQLITSGLIQPVPEDLEKEGEAQKIKDTLNRVMLARRKCELLAKKLGIATEFLMKSEIRLRYKDWLLNAADALEQFDEVERIIEQELEDVETAKEKYDEYMRLLQVLLPLSNYDVDLELRPQFFEYVVMTVDKGKLSQLIKNIDLNVGVIESRYAATEENAGVILLYPASESENIKRTLSMLGISSVTIPQSLPQNPHKAYYHILKMLDSIKRKLEIDFSFYASTLSCTYTLLYVIESALKIIASAKLDSSNVVVIRGYVENEKIEELNNILKQITKERYTLTIEEREEGPLVPSVIKVPRLLKPFQNIVLQYGAPVPNEIVPTLFLAITYPLIFGLMFQDAGHAIAIMLFGIYFYFKRKSEYGILFVYIAIPAFITGLLAGEFFGPLLGMKYILWGGHPPLATPLEAKSPEEALINLIGLALRVGSALIIIGVTLNLVNSYLSRDFVKMLLVNVPKLALFSLPLAGFVIFNVNVALSYIYDAAIGGATTLYGKVLRYGFIVSAISLLLLEPMYDALIHKKVKGLGMHMMKSLMEVFESVIAIIGNTASFLRILGLALAHAGIMFGFSAMAEHALRGGVGGVIAGITAYAFGNIVCIGIEGIVAYAQCMRLHFYEWFSKFYSGRGTIFSPIRVPIAIYFLEK